MGKWYEHSFGEDYLVVYKHRSRLDASKEVEKLVKWLKLKETDFILDLCCGMGRHTIALAERGFRVVGVDLSETLLSKAVQSSTRLSIPFIKGEMRNLPFVNHTFDVVINLFTSFGYFEDDQENIKALREMARVLKPDGRFLVDFLNRSAVEKTLVPVSEREQDGLFIREERAIDGDFVCKTILIRDQKGERRYLEKVKMYKLEQMKQMMAEAGLKISMIFGNFNGETYRDDSERMILVGSVKK